MITFFCCILLLIFILSLFLEKENKYLFIIGFLIISLIIISRFIERIPKDIYFNSLILLIIGISIIITNIFNIIMLKINFQHDNSSTLKNLFFKIKEFFLKIFIITQNNLLELYKEHTNHFFILSIKINNINKKGLYLLLCLDFLPKLILAICCFIDIIYYNKFYYFYLLIWIILIPLGFQAIIFILKLWTETSIKNLKNFVNFNIHEINMDYPFIQEINITLDIKKELEDNMILNLFLNFI